MCECLLAQAQLSFLSGGSEISDLVIKHLWWTNWVAVIFKAQLGQENDEMKRSVLDVDGFVNKAWGGSLYLSGWWLLSDELYSSGKSYSFGICDSDVHDENDSSCAFCGETWGSTLTPATPRGGPKRPHFVLIRNNFFEKSFLKNPNTEKNSNTSRNILRR